ncbi:tyrosine-type recombinase/integrase [Methylolobus aquaticus]
MPLTDIKIRTAKPADKPYKLHDERGLYLLVRGTSKLWRYDYRHDGKRKTLALGDYRDVSLKEARERRDEARRLLSKDVDPAAARKARKASQVQDAETFEAIAREWLEKFKANWTADHALRLLARFEHDVFPYIGAKPISTIAAPELLAVVRRIESRGAVDTAHRALQNAGQVFRYAVATGRAERDPSGDLRGALRPVRAKHHASITDPKGIGALLRDLDDYQGSHVTRCALRLAPLLFVRPGELRHMEWSEIDTDAAEWRLPAGELLSKVVFRAVLVG